MAKHTPTYAVFICKIAKETGSFRLTMIDHKTSVRMAETVLTVPTVPTIPTVPTVPTVPIMKDESF